MQKIRYVPPVEVVTHRLKTTILKHLAEHVTHGNVCSALLAHLSL